MSNPRQAKPSINFLCAVYSWWQHVQKKNDANLFVTHLTLWGRATHICVSKLIIIASDYGLSPGRRQAIIWNNAGILSIGLLGTNFSEILIEILTFSFKKMRLKVSSAKWPPFCLGLNVLSVLGASGCDIREFLSNAVYSSLRLLR